METAKDKIVWSSVESRTEWARLDKDNNLVHLDMDLCAQGPANAYTALAIGVWNAAVKAEREACAELVYNSPPSDEYESPLKAVYDAIRNRGNT